MGIANQYFGMWYVVEVLFVAHMILLYPQLAWLAKDVNVGTPKKQICVQLDIQIYVYIYVYRSVLGPTKTL